MAKGDRTVQTTLAVTLVVFISKASGFVREMIQAAYFGTGIQMDAYSAAYSLFYLPILLLNSCITSTLIPLYMQALNNESLKRANRFASNVLNLFAMFSLILSALMYLLATPLVHLVYSGFNSEKIVLTAHLTRVMMPSLVFVIMSIVLSSVLNARNKFIAAQLTGFPLTVASIAAAVFFSKQMGIEALAWGVVVAGVLQVVILLPSLRGTMRYTTNFSLHDKRLRKLILLAAPAMLSMAVNELSHMVDNAMASGLPDGSLSAMNYAFKLITFMLGVLSVPLITVVFSKMSERAVIKDKKGIITIVTQCIELVALVMLPIVAMAVVLSPDIIRLAYMRGKFDESSVTITANVFASFVLGLMGYALRDLINRAFHALQDTATPLIVAAGSMVLNVLFNWILIRPLGASGLALATTISATAGALVLYDLLRRKLGHLGSRGMLEQLLKIGIATALCALACIVLDRLVPAATGTLRVFLRLVVCAGGATAAYVGAVMALRVKQVHALKGMFRRQRA